MNLISCSRRSLAFSWEHLNWAATDGEFFYQKSPVLLPACGEERKEQELEQEIQGKLTLKHFYLSLWINQFHYS